MGTVVTVDLFNCEADPNVDAAVARVRTLLHEVDRVFSTYQPSSPINMLRREEISLDTAPPQVAEVLDHCRRAKEMTAGWFDPWALPGGVDPTGYVKGWAAQMALDALTHLEVSGAIVNAAGDIASFGGPAPAVAFRTGIVHPADGQRLVAVVELRDCLATSGESQRGAHLFNPFTRNFDSAVASASVAGPDLGICDALATALGVGGHEVMVLIDRIEGYEAMTVAADGSMSATGGFPFVSD